jgi:DNA repair exonuclease SbcCD ATPase subunit
MIACIAPGGDSYEETINTLKYAERAKKIKKIVNRNAKELELTATQYKGIIENLKEEITSLKEKMANHSVDFPPVVVNDIAIKELDMEIQETKALKDKYHEELMKDSLNLKSSQCEMVDDETQLYKISQELLSKYEDHYEMKQSVQELKELNEKNSKKLIELQKALDKDVRAKISEGLTKIKQEQIERSISTKAKEIEELQKAIETNESIKNQIEESLKENANIQQKYLALVVKLQNHKKKDVLELQIAVRTLKLERMDLLMQNLEIQKLKRVAELERQGKDKELAKVKKELEKVKSELKEREAQLANSAGDSQLKKDDTKTSKPTGSKENSMNRYSQEGSVDKDSSQMGLTLSYSKSDESKQPEQSFSSLSSVTVNYEDAPSSTDIELAQISNIQGKNSKHVKSGSFNDNVVNRKYSKIAAIYFTNGSK